MEMCPNVEELHLWRQSHVDLNHLSNNALVCDPDPCMDSLVEESGDFHWHLFNDVQVL